jgi:xanthine/uracil/vitamin C permease (AzgA family)
MGVLARYPIALAPGVGLNAFFTYSVVKGVGQAFFCSGLSSIPGHNRSDSSGAVR